MQWIMIIGLKTILKKIQLNRQNSENKKFKQEIIMKIG